MRGTSKAPYALMLSLVFWTFCGISYMPGIAAVPLTSLAEMILET